MLERFDVVGKALEVAVDDCLQTCEAIHNLYVDGHPINTIPPNLATSLTEYIPRIQSLREKLQLTENIIRHSVNTSSSLIPIHTLPVEILARVFQLVQGDKCIGHHQGRSQKLPVLMGICSYWRQVMINTPTFWSHIDLSIQRANFIRSEITYAEVYAARAAQTPLHVHIIERMSGSTEENHGACISLIPFIVSIASRVQSFRFEPRSPRAYRRILQEFIKNCTPGIFTTFHAHSDINRLFYLDTEVSLDSNSKTLLMDIPRERLEEVYLGMRVLRLHHLYPHWSSSAYQGLVELRLRGASYQLMITESQLVEVLRQSPGLRILECTTQPASRLNKDQQVQPINLIDLEILNLRYNTISVVEDIVRWLAPGPKPLKFIIPGIGSMGPSLAAFFARSNVTQVYLEGYGRGNASHIIPFLPSLRCIALAGWSQTQTTNYGHPKYRISNAAQSAVETIYIFYFYLTGFEILQEVVSLQSIRRVIFYGCHIQNTEEFLSGLSTLNPKASFRIILSHEPNPVDDWEIVAPRSLY